MSICARPTHFRSLSTYATHSNTLKYQTCRLDAVAYTSALLSTHAIPESASKQANELRGLTKLSLSLSLGLQAGRKRRQLETVTSQGSLTSVLTYLVGRNTTNQPSLRSVRGEAGTAYTNTLKKPLCSLPLLLYLSLAFSLTLQTMIER